MKHRDVVKHEWKNACFITEEKKKEYPFYLYCNWLCKVKMGKTLPDIYWVLFGYLNFFLFQYVDC